MSGAYHSGPYVDAVLDLWATGEGAPDIAARLGGPMTPYRVERIIARLRRAGDVRAGPRPAKSAWTAEKRARVAELISDGFAGRAIAAEVGMTANQIMGYIFRNGLKLARQPNSGGHKRGATAKPKPKAPSRVVFGKLFTRHAKVQPKAVVVADATPVVAPKILPPRDPSKPVIGFDALASETCRFPVGDPRQSGFGYCGDKCPVTRPYCDAHHRIAYLPAPCRG